MKRLLVPCFALAILLSASIAPAALMVLGYSPPWHDRFYDGPDKAFIGDPYDWSGVGRLVGAETWATMISPSYFISATHYHPGAGNVIRFFADNDPDGYYEDHMVLYGNQVGTSDLWIGKLDAPVSAAIETYPVLRSPSDTDYAGQVIDIFGRSDTSPTETNMRLGRNTINYISGQHLWWSYDNPGLGPDEAMTQGGDSGGGSFILFNGQPALVGIHHYVNGDTFVPSYIAAIGALMVGESLTVLSIPEPASCILAAFAAVGLLVVRRRSSRAA